MTYAEAQAYLYGLKTQKSTYGLERMRAMVKRMDFDRFPCVHVAGTNGKGSVCALLESIYRAAGYRTGLYSSPHLLYLGERVQVNREPISHQELASRIPELKKHAEAIAREDPAMHPSFFEFMTAVAFERFAAEAVDIALVEVGLGGRLDATNVLEPDLCVITSIGMDHAEILGDTLELIAAEKAGIIKSGVPVVLGAMPEVAQETICAIARDKGAPVYPLSQYIENPKKYPQSALKGRCQRINAAIASYVVELLQPRFPVAGEHVQEGLACVQWAGRWQRLPLEEGKQLILDATHNAEGAVYLDENLAELVASSGKPHMVAGTTGESRARSLMPVVARYARTIALAQPDQERAVTCDELQAHLGDAFSGEVAHVSLEDIFPKPNHCTLGVLGDTIVVTGSLYLIGEVMSRVLPNAPKDGARFQD